MSSYPRSQVCGQRGDASGRLAACERATLSMSVTRCRAVPGGRQPPVWLATLPAQDHFALCWRVRLASRHLSAFEAAPCL